MPGTPSRLTSEESVRLPGCQLKELQLSSHPALTSYRPVPDARYDIAPIRCYPRHTGALNANLTTFAVGSIMILSSASQHCLVPTIFWSLHKSRLPTVLLAPPSQPLQEPVFSFQGQSDWRGDRKIQNQEWEPKDPKAPGKVSLWERGAQWGC